MESNVQRFSEQEVSHAKYDEYDSSSFSDEELFGQNNVSKSLMHAIRRQFIGKYLEKYRRSKLVNKVKSIVKDEPFLRAKDRLSFMLGVFILMLTQFILTVYPNYLYILYTCLAVPLLIWRFMSYHKNKWHYFMLDFCYANNLLTMISLYLYPENTRLFKAVFCLSNGPLITAVVAWSNALVFHDVDRMTSLFIHLYPPLITFSQRWYANDSVELLNLSWTETILIPLIFYLWWQAVYIIKTEIIDKKKLNADSEIVTSARYLATVRPHPVYKFFRNNGINIHPNILLPLFQVFYTFVTLIPTYILYHFKYLHMGLILGVFSFSSWKGASYYFEVVGERYAKRLREKIEEQSSNGESKKKDKDAGFLPSSIRSFLNFMAFLIFAYGSLYVLICVFC